MRRRDAAATPNVTSKHFWLRPDAGFRALVHGFHDGGAEGGFLRGDERNLLADDGVEIQLESVRQLRRQIRPRLLAVRAGDMFAVEIKLSIDDAGMAFRSGNRELDRLIDVNPTSGYGCNRAVGETDDTFTCFIAARIAVGLLR